MSANRPPLDVAMVLAAGLGTRLAPLTSERPKPLVEVLGTPLVHFALSYAARLQARVTILNTHHLASQLEAALPRAFPERSLLFSHEPALLGTGGGIRQMAERVRAAEPGRLAPSSTILVINADALIDLDIEQMWTQHRARRPLGTLALKDVPDKARFGLIGTDAEDRVQSFVGRAQGPGPVVLERMFCGVHLFSPALLTRLPRDEESCINRVGYPPAIAAGEPVYGFDVPGYFCDVGTPERLLSANLELLSGEQSLRFTDPFARFAPAPGSRAARQFVAASARVAGELIGPCLIDEGAVVEAGARVGPDVVVGKGCRVGRGAKITRAVLQSGAVVEENLHLQDVICGRACQIPVPRPVT